MVFKQLSALSFVPEVDLFASRLNCQLTPFVSWKLEPGAWAVNAFSLKFYAFPPFSILGRVLAKVQQDGATGLLVKPFWSTASGVADRPPTTAPAQERPSPTEREVGHGSSTAFKAGSLGDNYIRAALQGSGLSTMATTLICNAWREGTKQQYNSTLHRWGEFCRAQEIHPVTPINDVVEFLSSLYADGGRSALGNFIHVPGVPVLANHPLIQKVVKGAYNTRPPAPCYVVIWDTDVLLQYLGSLDNACLNFKLLSCNCYLGDNSFWATDEYHPCFSVVSVTTDI